MESADQGFAVRALKRIREVAQASEGTVGSEMAPGANVTSDAQLRAFIKETLMLIDHAAATCTPSCVCDKGYRSLKTLGFVFRCRVIRRLHGIQERFKRGRRYEGEILRGAELEDRRFK